MVSQQEVTRLTDELQRLRSAVVRNEGPMTDRLARIQGDASRLLDEAQGTAFEPALRSVVSLLDCVARGMASQRDLKTRYRQAG